MSNGPSVYFVVSPKNVIVFESTDMSEALEQLHVCRGGSVLARDDGVVLAFMTAENSARGRASLSPKVKQRLLLAVWARTKRG